MEHVITGLLLLALAGSLMLPVQAAEPADPAQAAAALKTLRNRIKTIEQQLDSKRREESQASQSLRQVESQLARISKDLARTEHTLATQQANLAALNTEKRQLEAELVGHRDSLTRYLRTAYMLGRQESLKLLLNQEDPQRLGRTLAYYRYMSQARAAAISQVRNALTDLAKVEADIQTQMADLTATREQHRRQQQALERQRGERAHLVAELQHQIHDDKHRLSQMARDEQRLQKLLQELQAAMADVQQVDAQHKPFSRLKHKLPWPIAGKLMNRFGQVRDIGDLRWRGVFIAAPGDQPVRSISYGRVAFADWLRGFGLLIIVDHGDGYMSLYGHNRALYKEVGDWVNSGDVLATVGDSGGLDETGLYFELRKNGRPIDPLKWCAGQPTALRAAR